MQAPPEKLGSFYLGAEYDLATAKRSDTAVHYDARDLTTHGVCIGMTGSGKTGLCVGLLEEAALDGVPAILIDPKGDITNLLLQFPDLRPEDFAPWVNADDARRKGQSVEEFARTTAETWRGGLADWGIDPARIRALGESVAYTIFTPGSDAGVPINIVGSLAAPELDFDAEAEAVRERIGGTVAALLGLVGSPADPVRSREGILLANIFEHFWRQGQDLDLARLILSIQDPPVRQLGVFDVDTFYPRKERFELAIAFNNLVASPSFQSWLTGEPLDVQRLLFTAEGKPRHSILYLAHLSDSERMFIVTLLLENIVTWVRRQSGTTSLRALLYFDEVFGYFPPTAEPPSKRPLLTLLKQARAFGLGVVLVTQNPVDLDYKGLTNAGTWFIGKLQAERDKARVLEGLEGAIASAGGKARADYDALISQLGSRVFLLHNVHAEGPVVMQTRWAMSYLRGPLTRPQVRVLMAGRKAAAPGADDSAQAGGSAQTRGAGSGGGGASPTAPAMGSTGAAEGRDVGTGSDGAPATASTAPGTAGPVAPGGLLGTPPTLDPNVTQVYLPVEVLDSVAVRTLAGRAGQAVAPRSVQLVYEPAIAGVATVSYADRKRGIDTQVEHRLLAAPPEGVDRVDWATAEPVSSEVRRWRRAPETLSGSPAPLFAPAPDAANSATELKQLAGDLADWLYASSRLSIQGHADLGVYQRPGESERDFLARLRQAARERRDADVDKLQRQSETQVERIVAKLRKAEQALAKDEAEASARKQQAYVNIGTGVLGYLIGRRRSVSGTVSSVMTGQRMSARAAAEVEEGRETVEQLREQRAVLEAELQAQVAEIGRRWENALSDLAGDELAPKRGDVDVQTVALAWRPVWWIDYDDGLPRTAKVPAYRRGGEG